jgi:hypothetical protein
MVYKYCNKKFIETKNKMPKRKKTDSTTKKKTFKPQNIAKFLDCEAEISGSDVDDDYHELDDNEIDDMKAFIDDDDDDDDNDEISDDEYIPKKKQDNRSTYHALLLQHELEKQGPFDKLIDKTLNDIKYVKFFSRL